MKKFLVSFLVVFGLLVFENTFADTIKVYTSWTQGSIVTTAQSTGVHNNTICSEHNGAWHCGLCHVNHYTNGDYDAVPVCDCASRFKKDSTPDGTKYKKIKTGSETMPHSCENKNGMQQQEIHCTWYYEIWESIKVTSPSPKPSPTSQLNNPISPPSTGSSPEPTPTCTHPYTHEEGLHNHGHSDVGQKATAVSRQFYSKINTSEDYRRSNPFNVGSEFSLSGQGHIDGSVTHNPITRTWNCGGYYYDVCDWCEEIIGRTRECTASGSYNDYEASTPNFTDTYHNVSMSFEGFLVNGSSKVWFSDLSDSYESKKQKNFSSAYFNEYYEITELVPSELKEDDGKYGDSSSGANLARSSSLLNLGVLDVYNNILASTSRVGGNSVEKSGLLYGYAYVKCDCGCIRDRYRIYFDLTPPPPLDPEEYTLTLKAEGAPTTGGVKINNNGDYKDYTQKTSPIGKGFNISAEANSGYEFDAWYKLDEYKYSEKKESNVTMPGYNFTLIAKFKPLERYNVTVYSDGNGEVKFDGEYDDGQEGFEIYANVAKGDDISIIAKPNENYSVDFWELVKEDEDIGSDDKLTITDVQEDYIIFVHFKPVDPKENYEQLVTQNWGPGIAIGGTDYAIPGKFYPIWAIPNDGADFYFWEHQKGERTLPTVSKYGEKDIINMPNDKYVLTAWFQGDNETTYYDVIVEGDGNGDISINDEAPRSQDTTTVEDGTKITINAYPDDGFEFDKWTDEDGNVIPGGPKLTVTIDEDKIYIAHFEYIGKGPTLKVESVGGGKVRGNVDDAIAGKEYPIKAIPNENCEFLYWENKDTGEITDYADYDYVIMLDEDVTLVAHFREIGEDEKDKFYLTLKTQGSGTVSGEGWYKPDEDIIIVANPSNGYEFVGWYEDNLLVSTVEKYPPIKMPYYNMTLTAVFKLAEDNSESSPFKILSIRDVRWKDYFTGNGTTTNNELYVPSGATKNTVLVDSAKLIDNSYDKNRDIVYGYAVEFELVTTGVSRNQSNLSVIPTLYEKTSSGRLNKININLGEYGIITSAESKDIKDFMMTWEEKNISIKEQTAPQVTWRWVWYLPLDIYEDICDKVGKDSDIVVNFEMYVVVSGNQRFDYVKTINYKSSDGHSNWGGNVFTYRLDKTLLEDIYDNANN